VIVARSACPAPHSSSCVPSGREERPPWSNVGSPSAAHDVHAMCVARPARSVHSRGMPAPSRHRPLARAHPPRRASPGRRCGLIQNIRPCAGACARRRRRRAVGCPILPSEEACATSRCCGGTARLRTYGRTPSGPELPRRVGAGATLTSLSCSGTRRIPPLPVAGRGTGDLPARPSGLRRPGTYPRSRPHRAWVAPASPSAAGGPLALASLVTTAPSVDGGG